MLRVKWPICVGGNVAIPKSRLGRLSRLNKLSKEAVAVRFDNSLYFCITRFLFSHYWFFFISKLSASHESWLNYWPRCPTKRNDSRYGARYRPGMCGDYLSAIWLSGEVDEKSPRDARRKERKMRNALSDLKSIAFFAFRNEIWQSCPAGNQITLLMKQFPRIFGE